MRYILNIFFIIIPGLLISQSDLNKKAIEYYESRIEIVESLQGGNSVGIEYIKAIDYLEELTKIKACYEIDFSQEPTKMTTNYIIQDWKNWLKQNQKNIYWDEKLKIALVTEDVNYLIKNPKEEYMKNFEILKINTLGDYINITEQRCAYDFFTKLVSRDSTDLEWNEKKQMVLNSELYFEKLIKWFDKNKEKLIWDKENQEVLIEK
jgi:hypothetical protein